MEALEMGISLAMEIAGGGERLFPLNRPVMVLGRDSRCDLRVALPSVDKQHCEFMIHEGTVRFKDLGSGTGTFHNGTRVKQAQLVPDDRLTIGPVTFVVRLDDASG